MECTGIIICIGGPIDGEEFVWTIDDSPEGREMRVPMFRAASFEKPLEVPLLRSFAVYRIGPMDDQGRWQAVCGELS